MIHSEATKHSHSKGGAFAGLILVIMLIKGTLTGKPPPELPQSLLAGQLQLPLPLSRALVVTRCLACTESTGGAAQGLRRTRVVFPTARLDRLSHDCLSRLFGVRLDHKSLHTGLEAL